MCGIAGILGRLDPPNRQAVKRMTDALAQRGPDGEGLWISPANGGGSGVLLGHRRLAVLDLSTAADQPMVDPSTGDALITNGEIYNYRELRNQLRSDGEHFESTGDTAVMLRVLARGGPAAVRRLRGMYAFAFWDVNLRQLTLARDPLGIKPLYYILNPERDGDWSVLFASEVRAILASGLVGRPRLNPRALGSIVWNGFCVSPETAVDGVRSLGPGEILVFDEEGSVVKHEPMWQIPRSVEHDATESDMSAVLEESVRLHLASDVPIGVFLSGGVDSSSMANLARRNSTTPVHTFTLAFEEADKNEGPFARRIAAAIGTEHHETVLTEEDFIARLDDALDSLDQPSFDGINSYFMSHAVRQAGFVVILTGAGGDEVFGGYPSFRDLPRLYDWSTRARHLPRPLVSALARLVSRLKQPASGEIPHQSRWSKLPDMVERDDLLGLYQLAYALFLPTFQAQLIDRDVHTELVDGLPRALYAALDGEQSDRTPLEAVSALEQRLFLGERLLRDIDSTSMSASLETRLPLVDIEVLTCANALPTDTRFRPVGTKAMLRRIGLEGLDPELFNRPKSGFELPFDRWLKSNLGDAIDTVLRDADAVRAAGLVPETVVRLWSEFRRGHPGVYWSRIWSLYVFVRWCHTNQVLVGN